MLSESTSRPRRSGRVYTFLARIFAPFFGALTLLSFGAQFQVPCSVFGPRGHMQTFVAPAGGYAAVVTGGHACGDDTLWLVARNDQDGAYYLLTEASWDAQVDAYFARIPPETITTPSALTVEAVVTDSDAHAQMSDWLAEGSGGGRRSLPTGSEALGQDRLPGTS